MPPVVAMLSLSCVALCHVSCRFAEHSAEHIKNPVFAMQSEYDSWQTGHVLKGAQPVQVGSSSCMHMHACPSQTAGALS